MRVCFGLNSMTNLDISRMRIKHISDFASEGLRKMKQLSLADNGIQIINPSIVRGMHHVHTVYIHGNRLAGINWSSFQMFTNMLTL